MSNRTIIVTLAIVFALAFIGCDNGDDKTHTHEWGAWQVTKAPTVTAEGEQTRTCATCGEKETQPIAKLPVLCTCNPKEHYLPCDCEAAGTAECTCEVIPRGYIAEYETNVQIPIWQSVGVPNKKAATATTNIISGYNTVNTANKQSIAGKIQKVVIVNGTGASCTPSGIIEIGVDCPYDWTDIVIDIIKPSVL